MSMIVRGVPHHLRLSVTDRCNLRCFYCMPAQGVPEVSHDNLLSLEELAGLTCVIHRTLNLERIRITGGEPLVRKGLSNLLPLLPDVPDIAMTTNGLLLCEHAHELARAGLSRVNISLDSTKDSVLTRIARREVTLDAIEAAVRCAIGAGLTPVKINCVALRGINDGEFGDLVEWGARMGVHVRFIEHMPQGGEEGGTVLRDEIARLAGGGEPVGRSGTEETWVRPDGLRFGIIAPVSGHLCPTCGRVRLTAQGVFMPCLSGVGAVDLRPMVLSGATETELRGVILDAVAAKPERGNCHSLPMWRIGG
jgi:cyclic pyranopterin phosphate synthase